MKNINIFLTLIFIFPTYILLGQNSILYMGATAHLGNGEKIQNSVISIKDGKFDIIGNISTIKIDPSFFDTVYKVYDKHIYPSFIIPNTTIGITEIGSVRATHDYKEVGLYNPNVRSLTAYNSDSKISETIASNGMLIIQCTPRGGIISGQSSIMYLDKNNWEDAICKADDGIHLKWPSSHYKTGWWAAEGETKKNKKYQEKIDDIISFFKIAKSYFLENNGIDIKLESMKGLFNGSKTLYAHANHSHDIRKIINLSKELEIVKTVIVGAEDALKLVDELKGNDISLILNRIHRLPESSDSPIDEPFTQAKKLQENGILFCLSYEGDMEAMGGRNLPFTAGTCVEYGLNYEAAVSSITLNTAKILGIDGFLGSIEKGKDATFFISSGDALDIKTNNVEHAFIKGKKVDLENHQKRLYKKYKKN